MGLIIYSSQRYLLDGQQTQEPHCFHRVQQPFDPCGRSLTHWGRVTYIFVGNLTIIGPDNGLSPGRRQAIIWTNAGILLIGPWGTHFSEIFNRNSYIFIQENAFQNVVCEMASILSRPQCVKPLYYWLLNTCGPFSQQAICQEYNDINSWGLTTHNHVLWYKLNVNLRNLSRPGIYHRWMA